MLFKKPHAVNTVHHLACQINFLKNKTTYNDEIPEDIAHKQYLIHFFWQFSSASVEFITGFGSHLVYVVAKASQAVKNYY